MTTKKTTQAVHILKSYLGALSIPYSVDPSTNTVTVTRKEGSGEVKVRVGAEVDAPGFVTIDPSVIGHFDMTKAMSALHTVTEAAGYGSPLPVERGAKAEGRINYNDNFEDVYLRHSIFRRSPNMKDDALEPYMGIIKQAARKASFKWKNVFQGMGFGEGDLMTAGMVHTLSFLHNYAHADDQIENIKTLRTFLEQRFGEMAKITYKKALNSTCLPQAIRSDVMTGDEDKEVSFIESYAESEESMADEEYETDSFRLVFPNGDVKALRVENDGMLGLDMFLDGRHLTKIEAQNLTEDIRNGKVQKSLTPELPKTEYVEPSAKELHQKREQTKDELIARLSEMDPERRAVILSYAALSRDYCPDARRIARNLAEELVCPKCKGKVASGTTCVKKSCEGAQAIPLFGVDYMAVKKQLADQQHPMAEAMTAPIPESEVRARAKKPVVIVAAPLADSVPVVISAEERVTKLAENKVLAEKMSLELMAKLPSVIRCPKCKADLPKESFGVRVAKDKETGIPARASRQSYCKPCRKP